MNPNNSINVPIISSRLLIVGTDAFDKLGLTPEEIRIYVTIQDRLAWPERMRTLIPEFHELAIDEEEL